MNIKNIITEKRTSIVGLLIGLSTLCKAFDIITAEQHGAIAAALPDAVNFLIMAYLMLTKDGK